MLIIKKNKVVQMTMVLNLNNKHSELKRKYQNKNLIFRILNLKFNKYSLFNR